MAGVIIVVSLDLIPSALRGVPGIVLALIAFLVIVLLKVDVAYIALGAMATGIVYLVVRLII